MITAEVIASFNTHQNYYAIMQYDKQLYDKIEALASKKKVYTDLIWTKLFKHYRVSLLKIYDSQTIRYAIKHVAEGVLEDYDVEIVDTLTEWYFSDNTPNEDALYRWIPAGGCYCDYCTQHRGSPA
jgi:hypothetical protein